jgi:hypothetical protein
MADTYGKSYFSWVQRRNPCIPDPTSIAALSPWPLALSQTNSNPNTPLAHFSVPPCLRGRCFFGLSLGDQTGGRQ